MSDKMQETIADIIAWLRRPREGENAYLAAWRDEIADRLEAAHKLELSKNVSKNGADFGQLGDCAKLREALMEARVAIDAAKKKMRVDNPVILEIIDTALAAQPRNCDVWSAVEQNKRFVEYCKFHRIKRTGHADVCNPKCPCRKGGDLNLCTLAWAQMSYEKGGDK